MSKKLVVRAFFFTSNGFLFAGFCVVVGQLVTLSERDKFNCQSSQFLLTLPIPL